jgi:phenylacetate-CoA ligase
MRRARRRDEDIVSGEYYDAAETMPRARIEALRWRRLSRVLRYADEHLPFYQRAFAAGGYRPAPVRSAEEFAARVPRVRKSDIIAATREGGTAAVGIEALGAHAVSNVVMTSGTHGFNTFAFLTRSDLRGGNFRNAVRELWMVGVRPGMRVLTLSPAWHVLALLDTRAITAIGAEAVLPWGTLAPRFVPNFVDAVRSLRPQHLLVTAPVLRGMLEECERLGVEARAVFRGVRYIACAGESLSPAFRARVVAETGIEGLFERGGSSDGMFGGGECWARRGHHVFEDLHYIEVIDPRTGELLPTGRRGSAVVTNLTLGRSVYIRFEPEDVAEIREGDCPCGRTHPVVELYGRLSDSVILPDRIIAPFDVRCVVDEFPPLLGQPFEMGPFDGGGVRVRLSAAAPADDALLERLDRVLRERLGVPVSVSAGERMVVGWKGQTIRGRSDE